MKSIVIAIAGGSASGKTTLTNRLKNKFGNQMSVLLQDNYYKRNDDIPFEERKKINYDLPDAFDNELLVSHINMLRYGEDVFCPVYDFSLHNRSDQTIKISPSEIIFVEGILVLQNEKIRSLSNIKIFVDTDADERLRRRIERDVIQRGRKPDDIIAQYNETVKPMHDKYVEPSKKFADIIINGEEIDESTVESIFELIMKR